MDIFDIGFWAGTEASLQQYIATVKLISEDGTLPKTRAEIYGSADPANAAPELPRLFSKQGDIGVISIAGPLNNSDSWMNQFMGATGYPEIRQALVHAALQEDIKAIVLDIKSGGGAVSGVSDTAELIKTINTQVKSVHTYSDGMIASAAYWLGASAESVTIGNVTEAGSIGVLVMHQEMSKMLAADGITVNVIRSGQYKALGNGVEPLSALGKETLQAQVDQLNSLFVAHVADSRGTTAALVEEKMGQGRVFIGQAAADVGLVDAVSNYDAFMSKVQGGIDSSKQQSKYGANLPKGFNSMSKTALTAQALAALAMGAVNVVKAGDPALTPEQIAALAISEAEAGVLAAAALAATAAADAEAAAAAALAAKPANLEVVAMLQTQLGAAQAQVLQLSIDLQGASASVALSKAASEAIRPIVRAAVGNLRIALGGTSAGVEVLSDENLITEHANLAAQFDKKFKAGGVAAGTLSTKTEVADVVPDDRRRARLDATRTNSKQK